MHSVSKTIAASQPLLSVKGLLRNSGHTQLACILTLTWLLTIVNTCFRPHLWLEILLLISQHTQEALSHSCRAGSAQPISFVCSLRHSPACLHVRKAPEQIQCTSQPLGDFARCKICVFQCCIQSACLLALCHLNCNSFAYCCAV